jgi:hypothetical protein
VKVKLCPAKLGLADELAAAADAAWLTVTAMPAEVLAA